MTNTYNTQPKPFIVTIDGQVDKELSVLEPRRTPVSAIKRTVGTFYGFIHLQAEMAVYDAIHGTEYRTIRNALVKEQRNRAFETKIGLIKK